MKRSQFIWLAPVILLIGAAIGVFYSISFVSNEELNLEVIPVTRGSVDIVVTAQGTLEPSQSVDVGAQVTGQLEKLHFEIGDFVKKGDLLAEIDATLFEAEVAQDEARLQTLFGQKLETEVTIKQAKQRFERNKELLKANAISQEAHEETEYAYNIAKARMMSLDAQIAERQSVLEGKQAQLEFTQIFAPIDGVVIDLFAKEGETLNANQSTPNIVKIADLNKMSIQAEVAEADIVNISQGMKVEFSTLGNLERKWNGRVKQILPVPKVENGVVNYLVLVDVENHDQALMSGMTTQMFFLVDRASDVFILPKRALVSHNGQTFVRKVQTLGSYTLVPVETGLADRSDVEIKSGVMEFDKVAIPIISVAEDGF